ncbi:MAG: hypothetical protein AB7I25_07140 [Vicinamibacterales bacterium]
MKGLKIGAAVVVAVVAVGLLVVRIVGPEPANVPGGVVISHGLNYFVRPGLWQRGEVVRTPVQDWSFVRKFPSVVLETRSPYFIPHAVRVGAIAKGDRLYITNAQYRMDKSYPDRLWTSNVFRDPRVRLKIGDKLYEMTLVLVTDRAEGEAIFGRNPEYWTDEDGQERQIGYQHVYRAFQRNITEYGKPTLPRDLTGLPGGRLPDGRLSKRAQKAAEERAAARAAAQAAGQAPAGAQPAASQP